MKKNKIVFITPTLMTIILVVIDAFIGFSFNIIYALLPLLIQLVLILILVVAMIAVRAVMRFQQKKRGR